MDITAQGNFLLCSQLEADLQALESAMPSLQARAVNVFALASAWAERHDAIVAATPAGAMRVVEARLRRIGIRWGMMPGARMTAQFPALPPRGANDPA
jgi:hypothetical protein